jgi:stage II sporulation protein P
LPEEGGDLIRIGEGFLRNDTKYDNQKIEAWLQETDRLVLEGKEEPLVLIYHTHATESFERYDSAYYDTRNTWRSTDNNNNMVAVGAAMAHALEKEGIGVIHDTTQHDYPSYNGSYERSAKTIQNYLQQFPSIKIVLDLHRDAMERGKPNHR